MRLALSFAAACLALAAPIRAQQQQSASPLFASSEPVHLVIQAPLTDLARHREDRLAVPGTLVDPAGQSLAISLNLRGITRRLSETCDFPPLRVRFTAPPPPASLFAGQKSLKLVTHCRNAPAFQQYVLLEYATYRMYNLLTPHSFRVRLANIDYRDADGRPLMSRVGYFIEDLHEVAARNGLPLSHAPDRIPVTDLSPADAGRYALFQHMISNHDWSMRAGPAGEDCCHNAELIGPLSAGATIPVPYDFDFSGLVSPPYATPPDELRLSSVRQRMYRGYCIHNDAALAAARQMRDARPQMIAAIDSTPGVTPSTLARAQAFLDGFFADIATDDLVNRKILSRCLGFK